VTGANDPLHMTILVVFFNMRREAKRTLHTLTTAYQRECDPEQYDVVAIDHGSRERLDGREVEQLQSNFRYAYLDTDDVSPVMALNRFAASARGDVVVCLIDGARMLSPGMLSTMHRAFNDFEDPFVYTIGMHLGPEVQNRSVLKGYDQIKEDVLLEGIDWSADGYRLFEISSLALSSSRGLLGTPDESNCFALRKDTFLRCGGFDERFRSPGGGLASLELFVRLTGNPALTPVQLLGEATFHQFHGGVASNATPRKHPWRRFTREYRRILGRKWVRPEFHPIHFGQVPPEAEKWLLRDPAGS